MADYKLQVEVIDGGSRKKESKEEKAKTKLEDFNDQFKAFKKTTKGVAILQGLQVATKVIKPVIEYPLKTYGARYGDQARQNHINNIMGYANRGGGILTATASGAIAGNLAGPVGAAIGAAIAFVGSVTSEIIQGFQRVDAWNRHQQINNMNEVRQSERLGLMTSDRNRGRGR